MHIITRKRLNDFVTFILSPRLPCNIGIGSLKLMISILSILKLACLIKKKIRLNQ